MIDLGILLYLIGVDLGTCPSEALAKEDSFEQLGVNLISMRYKTIFKNQKYLLLLILSIVCLIGLSINNIPIQAETSFLGDFETGDLNGWETERCCDYSIKIANSPVRSGDYAVRFELRRDDSDISDSKRTEIKKYHSQLIAGKDAWYGFSIFIPNDWIQDNAPEIVAQWHAKPDFDLGETWRSPPLALQIIEDKWEIINYYDSREVTLCANGEPGNCLEGGGTVLKIPYEKGKWADWVFHTKWSYGSDGLLEIWKDGKKVANKQGPNAFNDKNFGSFKMGIYKWWWKIRPEQTNQDIDVRIIYHDEFRIGDSYEAVISPGNPPLFKKNSDLNNDNKVDVIDLGILLSNWGKTTKPPADINQDGKVDVIDLGILLSNWG